MAHEHPERQTRLLLGGVVGRHRRKWARVSVPATECPRISRAFLDGERLGMGDRAFRQEYLCEFADAEGQLFRDEYLERILKKGVPKFPVDWGWERR